MDKKTYAIENKQGNKLGYPDNINWLKFLSCITSFKER